MADKLKINYLLAKWFKIHRDVKMVEGCCCWPTLTTLATKVSSCYWSRFKNKDMSPNSIVPSPLANVYRWEAIFFISFNHLKQLKNDESAELYDHSWFRINCTVIVLALASYKPETTFPSMTSHLNILWTCIINISTSGNCDSLIWWS